LVALAAVVGRIFGNSAQGALRRGAGSANLSAGRIGVNRSDRLATTHRIRARHDRIESIKKTERHGFLAGVFNTTQGATTMTTTTSRRAVLAAAAAPAAAAPAAALAASVAPASKAEMDGVAILARAEAMIDRLRTCHIADGFKLDQDRAGRLLAYCRRLAADSTYDNHAEFDEACGFIRDHGQSLDWLFCGDEGSMVCKLAAKSSAAAKGDPVFAVIEEHRAAYLNLWMVQADTPEPDDDVIDEGDAYEAARARVHAADVALGNARPASVTGAGALLSYAREFTLGGVRHPTRECSSSEELFGGLSLVDEDMRGPRGNAPAFPLAFWIIDNCGEAIAAAAGKAVVS
jgi:hypothetical protein